jgi:hypothetical protein
VIERERLERQARGAKRESGQLGTQIFFAVTTSASPGRFSGVADTGSVDVSAVSIVNGRASATSTFFGTLRQLTGDGTVQVAGATFEVSGLPDGRTLPQAPSPQPVVRGGSHDDLAASAT